MKDPLDMLQPKVGIHGEAVAGRAATVKKRLDALAGRLADTTWDIAELLSEVHDGNYNQGYGFEDFDDYIEHSNFDMSPRQARYLIKINNGAKALGIPVDALKAVKITKLKEIFTLDVEKNGADIHELVDVAKTESLEQIKARVASIKGLEGQPEMTWLNLRVTKEDKDIILQAIERARRVHGDSMDGEDISEGRAVGLISADFLANPQMEQQEEEEPEMQFDTGEEVTP